MKPHIIGNTLEGAVVELKNYGFDVCVRRLDGKLVDPFDRSININRVSVDVENNIVVAARTG